MTACQNKVLNLFNVKFRCQLWNGLHDKLSAVCSTPNLMKRWVKFQFYIANTRKMNCLLLTRHSVLIQGLRRGAEWCSAPSRRTNSHPSQRATTHHLPNGVSDCAAGPDASSLPSSPPKQALHEHLACSPPGLVDETKFLFAFSFPHWEDSTGLVSSFCRVLQEN